MPNKLPPNWSWVKLGDIAKLVRGVSYKKELATKSPRENYLPIVRATNINSSLDFNDLVYVPRKLIKDEQIIKEGDVIIAMSSGSKDLVGKTAQAHADTEASFGTFCGLVRFSSSVNKRFFGYFFQSKEYRNHISKVSMGVNINNLRREHIEELIIPLPPLPEQKKIVEKIEELFSQLDSGVASLKKAKEQIRLYRQSVLAAAFSGRLTGEVGSGQLAVDKSEIYKAAEPKTLYSDQLPEGWKWVKLGEVVKLISGCAFKSNAFTDKGVLAIKISNIGYSEFVVKNQEYLPENYLSEYENYIVFPDDLLIALTRPITNNTTKVCFYPSNMKPALLNQRVAVLKSDDFLLKKYFYYYFQSEDFKKFLKSKFNETLQPNLSPKDLVNAQIPFCEKTILTQIVSEIEKRISEADNLEKAIDESLAKAKTLRQSILKKAFEGRLV